MFSTTFMDHGELLDNTSTKARHSQSVQSSLLGIVIIELALILGPIIISCNVYRNFGVKCMFSTRFIDPDELLANTSTNAHHSRSVQSL